MNPASPLQLDDEVEIIEDGHRFKISQIMKRPDGILIYSAPREIYYPASSLRKVEELQIGDWVEVVGDPCPLYRECPEHETGMIFQIAQIDQRNGEWFSAPCNPTYPASSLRKLAPDEIENCKKREWRVDFYPSDSAEEHLDKRIQVPEHMRQDDRARLSAIEKHLNEIGESHAELIGDVEDVGKRLAFVEAFQKDGRKDRREALYYAIRWLRMPDMRRDPLHSHEVADVLEEMMEEMQK